MNAESMVLFGGLLVLFSLLRKRGGHSKRTPRLIKLTVLLVEGIVIAGGTVSLIVGLKHFVS